MSEKIWHSRKCRTINSDLKVLSNINSNLRRNCMSLNEYKNEVRRIFNINPF